MRRIVLLCLLGIYFGAFAYFSVAPHHALADHYSRQKSGTMIIPAHNHHSLHASTPLMATQMAAFSAQFAYQEEEATQHTLKQPSWPPITLPDLSFLWRQQNNDQKKDIYNRGQ